jgi:hypothetical protein
MKLIKLNPYPPWLLAAQVALTLARAHQLPFSAFRDAETLGR